MRLLQSPPTALIQASVSRSGGGGRLIIVRLPFAVAAPSSLLREEGRLADLPFSLSLDRSLLQHDVAAIDGEAPPRFLSPDDHHNNHREGEILPICPKTNFFFYVRKCVMHPFTSGSGQGEMWNFRRYAAPIDPLKPHGGHHPAPRVGHGFASSILSRSMQHGMVPLILGRLLRYRRKRNIFLFDLLPCGDETGPFLHIWGLFFL